MNITKVLVTTISIVHFMLSQHFNSAFCQNATHTPLNSEVCGGDGNLRLLGGDTNMEGRVQVCKDGMWGSLRYCGQTSIDANVICKQLGYSQTGAVILDGVFMATNILAQHYISCSGNEKKVSECKSTCNTTKLQCCQTNMTLKVRCEKSGNECSVVVEVTLGAVAFLLLLLLVASSISIMILSKKLRHTKHIRHYESAPHQYVEQQIGQVRPTVGESSAHMYAEPVICHKNATTDKKEADYINTAKCIAYRPNVATTNTTFISSGSSRPVFQPSPSPTSDEYEIMQQLTYNT